jgi:hypothetical protein
VAVYYLLTSSISTPPISLAKAIYKSATIAPIISVRILKNDREDNDGRQTEDFDTRNGFLESD